MFMQESFAVSPYLQSASLLPLPYHSQLVVYWNSDARPYGTLLLWHIGLLIRPRHLTLYPYYLLTALYKASLCLTLLTYTVSL